jgi:cell division protein FtsB
MRKVFNFSKAAFWIGLLFILYMFAILTNETGRNYQLRSKSDELEQEIAQMQSQIEELGYKVTYYRTESYQDRLAREKLGLQKPGESVVIVKKESNQVVEVPAENIKLQDKDEYEASKSHWQQWREFLFGS